MLKRLKSVSMLLFLMGASTGAAYAVPNPGVTDLNITQQSGTSVSYTPLKAQGFSYGTDNADPDKLNCQRVWVDEGNPQL